MAGRPARVDMNVLDWIRAIGKRPHHRVGILRINIFANRDDDLHLCYTLHLGLSHSDQGNSKH